MGLGDIGRFEQLDELFIYHALHCMDFAQAQGIDSGALCALRHRLLESDPHGTVKIFPW